MHGADGVRPSAQKKDFPACNVLCERNAGIVAEPKTAEQLQYLARALRDSGDDSMWVGVTPDNTDGWQWQSNGVALTRQTGAWAPGQPDNDGQCVEMWSDATWNDRACSGDFYTNKVCPCEVPVAGS